MNTKAIYYFVFSLLILPIVLSGLIVGYTKVSQVHAQEAARNGPIANAVLLNRAEKGLIAI